MGLISGIIPDEGIDAIVEKANSNASKAVGDSKFKIPTPETFGVGVFIKMAIRMIEAGIIANILPVKQAKDIVDNANPKDLIKKINELANSLSTLAENPIQFFLDEGINENLKPFPIPIRLVYSPGGPGGGYRDSDLAKFQDFVNSSNQNGSQSYLPTVSYLYNVQSSSNPSSGQIFVNSDKANLVSLIEISTLSLDGKEIKDQILSLIPGQTVYINTNGKSESYVIKKSYPYSGGSFVKFEVSYVIPSQNDLATEYTEPTGNSGVSDQIIDKAKIDGKNSGISKGLTLPNNFLDKFIRNGEIVIPSSMVGLGDVPIINMITLNIGDFSKLPDDSPVKKYITNLEDKSGLKFGEVLTKVLKGQFPRLNFNDLEKQRTEGGSESSKEELIGLARLLQIAKDNPPFFIKMITGYFKLIVIPFKIVIKTLIGFYSDLAKKPLKILSIVPKVASNPVKVFIDLLVENTLGAFKPYIEPVLSSSGVSWEECLESSENGEKKGFKPLVTDLLLGKIKEKPDSKITDIIKEKYIPSKVLPVWDSIKGIIGLIVGLVSAIPSLLPAIIKNLLFSGNNGDMKSQIDNFNTALVKNILDSSISSQTDRNGNPTKYSSRKYFFDYLRISTTYGLESKIRLEGFDGVLSYYNKEIEDRMNFYPELSTQYGRGFRSVLYGLLSNLKDSQAPDVDYKKAESIVKALDTQIKKNSDLYKIIGITESEVYYTNIGTVRRIIESFAPLTREQTRLLSLVNNNYIGYPNILASLDITFSDLNKRIPEIFIQGMKNSPLQMET